jgi:type II secretory pathway pseudopilin PulG
MNGKGFTFIELILIITIIGILAVSVNVRSTDQSINLVAQRAQVVQDIRYTQSLAMSHGQNYRIIFGSNSYQITDNIGNIIPNPTSGLQNQPLSQGFVFANWPATSLTNRTLVFNSTGNPLQGTTPGNFSSGTETVTIGAGGGGGGGGCSGGCGATSPGVITIAENTGYAW